MTGNDYFHALQKGVILSSIMNFIVFL